MVDRQNQFAFRETMTTNYVYIVIREHEDFGKKFTPGEIINVPRETADKAYKYQNLFGSEAAEIRLTSGHSIPLMNLKRQKI